MIAPGHTAERMISPSLDERNRIIRSLVRAFETDPVANWMLRKDHKRLAGFDIFFRTCLHLCLRNGEVLQVNDFAGVSYWFPHEKWKMGYLQQARFLPEMIRAVGFSHIVTLIKAIGLLERSRPRERYYYLQVLGVDPDHQGKGLGSALLKPVLDRCDQEGLCAYLENSKERNLDFYSRHGFRVTAEIRVEKEAPPLWLMLRMPQ